MGKFCYIVAHNHFTTYGINKIIDIVYDHDTIKMIDIAG